MSKRRTTAKLDFGALRHAIERGDPDATPRSDNEKGDERMTYGRPREDGLRKEAV